MLGIAPLGSVPLAATLPYARVSNSTALLTFSGSARGALRLHMSAHTMLTFTGRAKATKASPGIIFTAIPENYEFRAEKISYDFVAMPQSFTFRGKPE